MTDAPPHPETMKSRKQTEPSRRRNDNPRSGDEPPQSFAHRRPTPTPPPSSSANHCRIVNYLVPEGPRLAKGLVASPVVRSLCLAHLVLTSCHEGMLLDCAIACVPRYMGLRTQHRVIDKTRFLLRSRYTQSEYANKIERLTVQ